MELRKSDPFLGATQPKSLGKSNQDTIVLFLSACNTPLKKLQNLDLKKFRSKLICVVPDTNSANRLVTQRSAPQIDFVFDKESLLRKQLNATFTPRCYAFANGQLKWKQNYFEGDIAKLANSALSSLGESTNE